MTDANQTGFAGQKDVWGSASEFNKHVFLIQQILGKLSTSTLVQVQAVHGGGLAPVGTVDVLPLVNLIDGQGNSSPHGIVHGLPYFRLQGGANAVILDPVVGDIGIAVFADRDISGVKSAKTQANPGSRRRFDFADGLYIGGVLNGTPTCYVAFVDGGVTVSPDAGVTTIVATPGEVFSSPDGGATAITMTPGKIVLMADEIVAIGRNKNIWGTSGAGFVYQPAQIDTYTDGVPSNHHSPPVPES